MNVPSKGSATIVFLSKHPLPAILPNPKPRKRSPKSTTFSAAYQQKERPTAPGVPAVWAGAPGAAHQLDKSGSTQYGSLRERSATVEGAAGLIGLKTTSAPYQ